MCHNRIPAPLKPSALALTISHVVPLSLIPGQCLVGRVESLPSTRQLRHPLVLALVLVEVVPALGDPIDPEILSLPRGGKLRQAFRLRGQ